MTFKRCDICIDSQCGCDGSGNCDCGNCKHKEECPKVLRPTITITDECTQSCSHCCFKCSPKKSKRMTLEMAENIRMFMINNGAESANIMGGEFFLHPEWKEIITILVKDLSYGRLVSNGDWVESKEETEK